MLRLTFNSSSSGQQTTKGAHLTSGFAQHGRHQPRGNLQFTPSAILATRGSWLLHRHMKSLWQRTLESQVTTQLPVAGNTAQ